ncbi:methyltransferase domain-containing protein, partial [Paenibacillus sp. TAF58]
PMEEKCGIPEDYFDFVYSVYAIGWTTDLEGTFCRIASYLKKDGAFIFSWSHPIHKCVVDENNTLVFKKCYFDESWYSSSLDESTLTLSLLMKIIRLFLKNVISMNLGIRHLLTKVR